jgi:hypothetical protein
MEIYFMVAIIYFVISFVAARLVRQIERILTPRYLRIASKGAKQPISAVEVTPI